MPSEVHIGMPVYRQFIKQPDIARHFQWSNRPMGCWLRRLVRSGCVATKAATWFKGHL